MGLESQRDRHRQLDDRPERPGRRRNGAPEHPRRLRRGRQLFRLRRRIQRRRGGALPRQRAARLQAQLVRRVFQGVFPHGAGRQRLGAFAQAHRGTAGQYPEKYEAGLPRYVFLPPLRPHDPHRRDHAGALRHGAAGQDPLLRRQRMVARTDLQGAFRHQRTAPAAAERHSAAV